jgi:hypothetical protein
LAKRDDSPAAILRRIIERAANDPNLSQRERVALRAMARDDLPDEFRGLLNKEMARDLRKLGYTGLRRKKRRTTDRRANRWKNPRQSCIDALRAANFPSARGYERWRANSDDPGKWPTRHTIMDELGGGVKPSPAYPGQTGRHAVGGSWAKCLDAARP